MESRSIDWDSRDSIQSVFETRYSSAKSLEWSSHYCARVLFQKIFGIPWIPTRRSSQFLLFLTNYKSKPDDRVEPVEKKNPVSSDSLNRGGTFVQQSKSRWIFNMISSMISRKKSGKTEEKSPFCRFFFVTAMHSRFHTVHRLDYQEGRGEGEEVRRCFPNQHKEK